MCRYLMPASAHLAVKSPVHSSAAVTKPSATTSLTLSLVIATGVSSTAGTSCLLVGSLTLPSTDFFWPFASETARSAAASASFLSTESAALPRPSLAASTPAMFGFWVSICSKIVAPWALSHSGTDWSGPFTNSPASYLGLSTESYPFLNRVALLSVGDPLSSATTGFCTPLAVRHFTRPSPCSLPTAVLSKL